MSWYLAAANLCVLFTLSTTPGRGWSLRKALISLVLVAAGELILLLAGGATTLTLAMMALLAGLLMLAEMTRSSRLTVGLAWMAAGVLLVVLNWEKSTVGEWVRQSRPWLAIGGIVAALAFGTMAWRSENLARGKYGDLGGM